LKILKWEPKGAVAKPEQALEPEPDMAVQ